MLDEIIAVVKKAGEIIIKARDIRNTVESKEGRANFVTLYDKEVQSYLFHELSKLYPTAVFIGEEEEAKGNAVDKLQNEYCFIIDPIDGTTNFILDYHHSAISVALLYNGQPAAGVVYDPYQEELFYSEKGTGAFLNGKPLIVKNLPLQEGLVALGTCPYHREKAKEVFNLSYQLFERALDVRRTGSAALDICYVAAGRFVLYFEPKLSPWDYAAGQLILTEAGGCISTMEHTPLIYEKGCSAIAATPCAYEEFFAII